MKVVVAGDTSEAAKYVASAVVDLLCAKREAVLGLAGGRTFEQAYRLIVEQRVPLSDMAAVVLDEYVGLGTRSVHSFRHQARSQLTDGLGLDPSRLHSLDGDAPHSFVECRRFERTIEELGGVDLQLLGLGRNGHIAFNEPGSMHDSRTRIVQLTEETRSDNTPAFGRVDLVPHHALTQGIGTILEARKIILMATGPAKAVAVAAALNGPVNEIVPASALQLHGDTTVILDPEAAALLGRPWRGA